MAAIAFSSVFSPLPLDVVISEKHTAEIEITEIPIESGARITDHAFILPKKLTLEAANENAAASYNALVAFQESRVPFDIVTGLFVYRNMLVKSISATRDKQYSSVLRFTADLQEVLIVSTSYVADPTGEGSGDPNSTSSSVNSQNAGDTATADRTTGTEMRGDTGTTTVPQSDTSSYLRRLAGTGSQ